MRLAMSVGRGQDLVNPRGIRLTMLVIMVVDDCVIFFSVVLFMMMHVLILADAGIEVSLIWRILSRYHCFYSCFDSLGF